MKDILWVIAGFNVLYLVYALWRHTANKTSSSEQSIADRVRVLDIPEDMLSAKPVAKSVHLKAAESAASTPENWWEAKIQRPQGVRTSRRRHLDHNQLILSDLDRDFS